MSPKSTDYSYKLFKLVENKVEPTSGFLGSSIHLPPVTPEVIYIQVLWTCSLLKTLKGLNQDHVTLLWGSSLKTNIQVLFF